MPKDKKAFIFDLDKTICTECTEYDENLRGNILNFMKFINGKGYNIYIVTARSTTHNYNNDKSIGGINFNYGDNDDKLYDFFKSMIHSINIEILHEILINIASRVPDDKLKEMYNGDISKSREEFYVGISKIKKADEDYDFQTDNDQSAFLKAFRTLMELNFDPATRWFYSGIPEVLLPDGEWGTYEPYGREINLVDERCRLDKFLNNYLLKTNIYNKFENKENGSINTDINTFKNIIGQSVIKMLQIIDISQLGNYSFSNIYFFDDSILHFWTYLQFSKLSKEFADLTFFTSNFYMKKNYDLEKYDEWVNGISNYDLEDIYLYQEDINQGYAVFNDDQTNCVFRDFTNHPLYNKLTELGYTASFGRRRSKKTSKRKIKLNDNYK